MPYMKQVFDAFPEVRRYFHNDFTSNSCYPYLAEMGVEVFNFTHMQEIGESRKLVGDKVVFMGNVPPMLLAQGDPKTVYETTKSVIESYVAANGSHHGLLIGPGGGMPMGAVKPNIDAMIQAVKDYNLTL